MRIPAKPKSPEQIAAEKEKAEFDAQWNRVGPERGVRLEPRKPAKDAKEMTKAELALEWRLTSRERIKSDSPTMLSPEQQRAVKQYLDSAKTS